MKRRKLRGSTTAGRGYGKRARKAGNRGGRGRAGGGKRGQQNMMSIRAHEHRYSLSLEKKVPLNLNNIERKIDSLKKAGTLEIKDDKIIINLKKLGYSKVCGRFGKAKPKIIVYGTASERARNEILSAGGEVV